MLSEPLITRVEMIESFKQLLSKLRELNFILYSHSMVIEEPLEHELLDLWILFSADFNCR